MRGPVLSGLPWSRPGQTGGGAASRRRRALIVAAVLLPCLLGILAFVASRPATPAGRLRLSRDAYNLSGWMERAGLEARGPLAPPGGGDLFWPNGTERPAAGPFRYIINEENKCPAGEEPPFLVLLITVEAHQVERRDAIRRTWGAESPLRRRGGGGGAPGAAAPGPRVVRLFLLGVKEEEDLLSLEEESLRHGDILQQDFADTYRNLTAKTLMGLNWVARHCPRAAYVMKTDSDVFVNTDYLVRELLGWPDTKPRRNLFTGNFLKNPRPIRDKDCKWYVSEEEYPSETYPEFCAGTGYVFSGDLATRIYGGSLGVPRFPFEDVYVGMVLERLHIPITPPPNPFLFGIEGLRPDDSYSLLVVSHKVTPDQMLDIWRG